MSAFCKAVRKGRKAREEKAVRKGRKVREENLYMCFFCVLCGHNALASGGVR